MYHSDNLYVLNKCQNVKGKLIVRNALNDLPKTVPTLCITAVFQVDASFPNASFANFAHSTNCSSLQLVTCPIASDAFLK